MAPAAAHARATRTRVAAQGPHAARNPFAVGVLALVVIVVVAYFGFTKHVPFTHGFRVKAVFQSANSIRPNSPVRIAGVNVGKVKKVERQAGTDNGRRDDGDRRTRACRSTRTRR